MTLDELDDQFDESYLRFQEGIDVVVKSRRWFDKVPGRVALVFFLLALFFIFVAPILTVVLSSALDLTGGFERSVGFVVLAFVVLGVVSFAQAIKSTKEMRTSKGSAMYARVLGFRRFLSAGQDRFEHAERAQIFIDFLPYAVAMGVVSEWTKRFDDLATLPDMDWFESDRPFTPGSIGTGIDDFNRRAGSGLAKHTVSRSDSASRDSDYGDDRSSGGSSGFSDSGSSGGGGGGGGGGSW